jgi:hypothetical protein
VNFDELFFLQGDQVDEFQPLCEVQSDKATIEITSRFRGKVHQIHFGPGDIVKVFIRLICQFYFFNLCKQTCCYVLQNLNVFCIDSFIINSDFTYFSAT